MRSGANTITPSNATWTDIYNDWKNGTSNVDIAARAVIVGLRERVSPALSGGRAACPTSTGGHLPEGVCRVEKNGNLPNLNLLLLYDDHTEERSPDSRPQEPRSPTTTRTRPHRRGDFRSHTGRSRRSCHRRRLTDGLDHVTASHVGRRSAHTRHGIVDSNFYDRNMYRTIEQILGLPPRNQFDLAAEPMFTTFTSRPDFTAYAAIPNRIPLNEMNPPLAGLTGLQRQLAEFSLTIDSSEPDSAPADTMNRAIWHSVKGFDTPYNYGRPIRRSQLAAFSLLKLAGFEKTTNAHSHREGSPSSLRHRVQRSVWRQTGDGRRRRRSHRRQGRRCATALHTGRDRGSSPASSASASGKRAARCFDGR